LQAVIIAVQIQVVGIAVVVAIVGAFVFSLQPVAVVVGVVLVGHGVPVRIHELPITIAVCVRGRLRGVVHRVAVAVDVERVDDVVLIEIARVSGVAPPLDAVQKAIAVAVGANGA
jgi:hypothetical protein